MIKNINGKIYDTETASLEASTTMTEKNGLQEIEALYKSCADEWFLYIHKDLGNIDEIRVLTRNEKIQWKRKFMRSVRKAEWMQEGSMENV